MLAGDGPAGAHQDAAERHRDEALRHENAARADYDAEAHERQHQEAWDREHG
jgi:hypothetical protein